MVWRQDFRANAVALSRRFGRRVIVTPPGPRLGNSLYLWLYVWGQRQRSKRTWLTPNPKMTRYLEVFPAAGKLVLRPGELRRTDRRDSIPAHYFQRYGVDFRAADLKTFIRSVIEQAPVVKESVVGESENTAAIHIRRGDYYSNPDYRRLFSMDIHHYLKEALEMARQNWGITEFQVVSDDYNWCKMNLRGFSDRGFNLVLPTSPSTEIEDFVRLCESRYLIISNSTFSQWGAHVSVERSGDPQSVICPTFGIRTAGALVAWGLNPTWLKVENHDYEWARDSW